jgi:hypothetical protein
MFENTPIIHRYTRAQAIADGTLVDVTESAKLAGFRYPVAMTPAAIQSAQEEGLPDREGAIEGILLGLRQALRFMPPDADRVTFAVNDAELYAVCGPGDTAEPVVTVMEVGQD